MMIIMVLLFLIYKRPNVETIHGIYDDGKDKRSEVIFRKDGTAYIVNLDETFVWNQQLFDKSKLKSFNYKS